MVSLPSKASPPEGDIHMVIGYLVSTTNIGESPISVISSDKRTDENKSIIYL